MNAPHRHAPRATAPQPTAPARARMGRLRVVGALALAAAASSCGEINLREELGLIGQGPDPFTVVSNRPLEIPEDRSNLPTPQPGAPSRVEPTPERDAQVALTGAPTPVSDAPSASEQALLRASGADGASDDVRSALAEEAADGDEWRLLDDLFGDEEEESLEEALDASEEARRLSERAQETTNPNLILPPPPED